MEVEGIQQDMVEESEVMNSEEQEEESIDELDNNSSEDNDNYECLITDDDDDDDDDLVDKSFLLPRETTKRIVREIANNISNGITEGVVGNNGVRISAAALEVLREAATGQVIEMFEVCNRLVHHRNRDTIIPQDLHLFLNLVRDLYGPTHPLLKQNSGDTKHPDAEDGTTNEGIYTNKRTTSNSTRRGKNEILTSHLTDEKEKKKKGEKKKISNTNTVTIKKSSTPGRKKVRDQREKQLTNTRKKKTNSISTTSCNDIDTNSMDVEPDKTNKGGEVQSKKRKLEKLNKKEEEDRRITEDKKAAEKEEELNREKKRAKREEMKRKSKLIQQESLALIQKFVDDNAENDDFHYEFEDVITTTATANKPIH